MDKVNLQQKFALFSEHWSPKIVGELNGQQVKLVKMEGEGGMIGVDAAGNYAMILNCAGMYRGVRSSDGSNKVAIYK